MEWTLFATVAETAGANTYSVSVSAEEPTLRDAFDSLLAAEPDLEAAVLDDAGDLQPHIRLLYNGSDPFRTAAGWQTPVDPDDELALFPPVSGG